MAIEKMFHDASSVMTVISFITFIGILWWTFGFKRSSDFDNAAQLPFADELKNSTTEKNTEKRHG